MLFYIDRLVPERGNSSALAMELRLSCTNPWIYASQSQQKLSTGQKLENHCIKIFSSKNGSHNVVYNMQQLILMVNQGSFCVCAQPMRDDVTM